MDLTTSVEFVDLLMNHAESMGINPDRILRKVGLDISILEKTNLRISIVKMGKIWLALEESSSDRDLGLHLGEKYSNIPGHILFLLMVNSATIKDAVDNACQYFNLLTNVHSPRISIRKNLVEMALHYNIFGIDTYRHSNEAMLAAYASILYRLSEQKMKFEAVQFTHPQPDDLSEHRRIFNAPLFFGQAKNKLVFKEEFLSLPVNLSNQNILQLVEKEARELQERLDVDGLWSVKVTRTIFFMLGKDKIEIVPVADKLAISPRNLQHKLKKEGVTFQELLDHVRKEMAKYLLENESIPVNEIAHNLGYAEQSVFTRAFKKWTGIPPKQYRDQL